MPQRFLRPGIRTSERWNAISRDAQSLFISLLTLVDDYGRYIGRLSVIWADCFAVWNDINPQLAVNPQQCAALCQQLADKKLVEFYEVDGKRFLQITQWEERKRGKSKYPAPQNGNLLRNPAESCGILPPEPSPVAIAIASSQSPTPSSSPPPKAAETHAPAEPPIRPKRLHGIPDSVDDVIAAGQTLHAKKDEETCREFWSHYEGQARTTHKGEVFWITSGDAVVTNWRAKLEGFKGLHVAKGQNRAGSCGGSPPGELSPSEKILRQKDLERIEARIKQLRDNHPEGLPWKPEDRAEIKTLKERREVLKKILGLIA
jgi:hypothetical protein